MSPRMALRWNCFSCVWQNLIFLCFQDLIHAIFKLVWSSSAERNEETEAVDVEVCCYFVLSFCLVVFPLN